MQRRRLLSLMPVAGATMAAARTSVAETYPARPVRIVSPSPPGGVTDIIARLLADSYQTALGQRFIIENKAGASGTIAAHTAARAPADGYTLFTGIVSTQVIQPAVRQLPYDPETAFTSVGLVSVSPMVLVVNASLPVRSVHELVAYSQKNKGSLNFSVGGLATLPHLLYELLARETALSGQVVAYNGSTPSLQAAVNGEVAGTFEGSLLVRNQIASGALRALAVTTQSRDPTLPNVPTMVELGFRRFVVSSWTGLFAPTGTPGSVVATLNKALNFIAGTEEFKAKLAALGAEPQPGTPEALTKLVADENARWGNIVRAIASSMR